MCFVCDYRAKFSVNYPRSSRITANAVNRLSYFAQPKLQIPCSTASLHISGRRYAFDEVDKTWVSKWETWTISLRDSLPIFREHLCVGYNELKKLVDNDNVLIVDVRRKDEVDNGRIPAKRYVNIPVQDVGKILCMVSLSLAIEEVKFCIFFSSTLWR